MSHRHHHIGDSVVEYDPHLNTRPTPTRVRAWWTQNVHITIHFNSLFSMCTWIYVDNAYSNIFLNILLSRTLYLRLFILYRPVQAQFCVSDKTCIYLVKGQRRISTHRKLLVFTRRLIFLYIREVYIFTKNYGCNGKVMRKTSWVSVYTDKIYKYEYVTTRRSKHVHYLYKFNVCVCVFTPATLLSLCACMCVYREIVCGPRRQNFVIYNPTYATHVCRSIYYTI